MLSHHHHLGLAHKQMGHTHHCFSSPMWPCSSTITNIVQARQTNEEVVEASHRPRHLEYSHTPSPPQTQCLATQTSDILYFLLNSVENFFQSPLHTKHTLQLNRGQHSQPLLTASDTIHIRSQSPLVFRSSQLFSLNDTIRI